LRIKDFLARHRVATPAMLKETGYRMGSAYRQLRRMEVEKQVESTRISGRGRAYFLPGTSLGPQQLAIAYATAMHCSEFNLHRPHVWETRSEYPWLDGIDFATGPEGVVIFRVHISGKSDAQVRKAIELHRRLSQYQEYLELLEEGRIIVRILTATERKAQEINWYINRANSPVPIEYSIVPGYEQVLGDIDDA
jgi:hypothetical protein